MRIMVIGATGVIGSALIGRLAAAGHDVVAAVRGRGPVTDRLPVGGVVTIDMAEAQGSEHWLPHLRDIDAVVNCAGVLQDSPRDSTAGVHATGAAALFRACEEAGVHRVVHLSAVGVDRGTPSDFSRSKLAGDEALVASDLDWVILRPSVVLGRPAYGGSALFRGLAALPVLPVLSGTGPLQVVQLEDLVETILFFLAPAAPTRRILEIVGPDRLQFAEVVAAYRRWLGWPRAPVITLPRPVGRAVYRLGDLVSMLGWRPPMRSTAGREIARGAVGNAAKWTATTGIVPSSLAAALAAEPATVQERWFAQLYLLKPAVLAGFALFWILTGIVSLGPGWQIGVGLMEEGGAGALAAPSVVAGALADILIGIGILFRRTARIALYAAIGLSLFYAFAGSILLPRLWAEPLGPMLKILPILLLNLVALAILEDR